MGAELRLLADRRPVCEREGKLRQSCRSSAFAGGPPTRAHYPSPPSTQRTHRSRSRSSSCSFRDSCSPSSTISASPPTEYWSRSNIADGVNALATTDEMVVVGLFQLYALFIPLPYTPSSLTSLILLSFSADRIPGIARSPKAEESTDRKCIGFFRTIGILEGIHIGMDIQFLVDQMRAGRVHQVVAREAAGRERAGLPSGDPEHARIRGREGAERTQKPAVRMGPFGTRWTEVGCQASGEGPESSERARAGLRSRVSLLPVPPFKTDHSHKKGRKWMTLDPLDSPYFSSPFAENLSGHLPPPSDIDTLFHSSASSRHIRAGSDGSGSDLPDSLPYIYNASSPSRKPAEVITNSRLPGGAA
ncbi:hypothetical protein PtA15_4A835 [Puccinia triticina]|uniref:Uncharacterized protein n=1 Tax=Puccinia triticina TaxID=208348 RepID=A0ABY7CIR4_9BASI|nr:uncharacterized protein PtA15_4A835 [Puccinia triticina]WAQ84382.1 hypothetical protein PtA15_4A835 [Puccinia triticina]